MGPMKAANAFAARPPRRIFWCALTVCAPICSVPRLDWQGPRTDKAVILGLRRSPDTVDPDTADAIVAVVRKQQTLRFAGRRAIAFDAAKDIIFDGWPPPGSSQHIGHDCARRARRCAVERTVVFDRRRFRGSRGTRSVCLNLKQAAAALPVSLRSRSVGARHCLGPHHRRDDDGNEVGRRLASVVRPTSIGFRGDDGSVSTRHGDGGRTAAV